MDHIQTKLVAFTAIITVAGLGQILAQAFRIPSILILLLLGVLAGPLTGVLDPNWVFGDLLIPIISLAVAVILFEGGMSLGLHEGVHIGRPVLRLITFCVLITVALITYSARTLLGFSIELSLLIGTVLSISGPTVVTPLLRHIRPKSPLGPILRWEGILVDPIGVIIAVMVFEGVIYQKLTLATFFGGVVSAFLIGAALGLSAGYFLAWLYKKFLISEENEVTITLTTLFIAFVLSNIFAAESGLVCAVIMGMTLSNLVPTHTRKLDDVTRILCDLAIGLVFIILSARLTWADIEALGLRELLFLIVLIIIVRPTAVFLSLIRSGLTIRQKTFIACIAPRGIVAAAMSSLLALQLAEANIAGSERLVSVIFFIIAGTVVFYGIAAPPLARLLRLSEEARQGVIFVGAQRPIQIIALTLKGLNVKTILVDTNPMHVAQANRLGLEALVGSGTSEHTVEQLDFSGIGRMLAVTPNDEANSLAVVEFSEIFGRSEVYQLAPESSLAPDLSAYSMVKPRGRILFGTPVDFNKLSTYIKDLSSLQIINLTSTEELEKFEQERSKTIPLFSVDQKNNLTVHTSDLSLNPKVGQRLIVIVPKEND